LLDSSSNRAVYWIRWFYLLLIPGVVGFMFLHNFLDFFRKARLRLRAERARPQTPRMTRNERWQHVLLLISFSVLVWTGFALRFPESFWAQPLVGWEGDWPVRAWLHRGAAVVLLAAAALHLFYLATNPEARRRWRHFLPRATDWADFRERMRFYLGLRPDPPRLSDKSYVEKIEYWAVLWGTVLMGITGIVLWSTDFTLRHLTNLFLDVATAIHYYEAILATLAIVVWHFYSVIFDPDHYPMQWTWITGSADAEHWASLRYPPAQETSPPSKKEKEEERKEKESAQE
jgi:cytochrome b subunit of formate dehydrogenase